MSSSIHHGGDVNTAVARFGRARHDWIDLSTGINPIPYPVSMPPADIWHRLPNDNDGLAEFAAAAFGAEHALPVAGSQAAIRALPHLLPRACVAIADLTYGEYAPAFTRAGHDVRRFAYDRDGVSSGTPASPPGGHAEGDPATAPIAFTLDCRERRESGKQGDAAWALPSDIVYLVIVNPNNPTADLIPPAVLLAWRDQLLERGGALIVDEAFIECTPTFSVAAACGGPGLIVLRSIGKFYGLAGVRAGCVLGPAALLAELRDALGAWAVSGPACHAMREALADTAWQAQTRRTLRTLSGQLNGCLLRHGLSARQTDLFAWVPHAQAAALHDHLASQGIWTRLFAQATPSSGGRPSIRFGLPAIQHVFDRLDTALTGMRALIERTSEPYPSHPIAPSNATMHAPIAL